MEIESIREKLARAADTGQSDQHICEMAARPSGRTKCGAGAGCSAMKCQSLFLGGDASEAPLHPLGPLGSSSSQHRRTPEIVL